MLVVSVLLQSGKGGGLAGAFGGQGGAQTIFGGRGAATFLSKATTVLGALFLLTALLLALVPRPGERPARSVVQEKARQEQEAPVRPPEAVPPGEVLPGAGTLPGGTAPPAGGGESGEREGQKPEGTQGVPSGAPSGGQSEKADEG